MRERPPVGGSEDRLAECPGGASTDEAHSDERRLVWPVVRKGVQDAVTRLHREAVSVNARRAVWSTNPRATRVDVLAKDIVGRDKVNVGLGGHE